MERCEAENRCRRRRVRLRGRDGTSTQLVYVDHVAFQVGEAGALAQAMFQIYASADVPDIMPGGDVHFDTEISPYVWRLSPSDSQLGSQWPMAKYFGYTEAAGVFIENEVAQALGPVIMKESRSSAGRSSPIRPSSPT